MERLSPHGGQVIIKKSPDIVPSQEVAPPAAVMNEDDVVNELEQARQKRLEKVKKIDDTTKALAAPIINPLEEIQKLGHKQIDAAALLDDKVLAVLQKTLKAGLTSKVPSEEIRAMIQLKLNGSFWEWLFKKYPSILNIAVDIVKDQDALAGLLGILIRKEDLKTYGFIWLVILIFGLYVNRLIRPKLPFLKRIGYKLTISFFLTVINIFLFYSFFSEELAPTLSIISKHI